MEGDEFRHEDSVIKNRFFEEDGLLTRASNRLESIVERKSFPAIIGWNKKSPRTI
jgi:hypothetical protein